LEEKQSQILFWLGPLILISIVFFVTLSFSFIIPTSIKISLFGVFKDKLFFSIPLLTAYYSTIYCFILYYKIKKGNIFPEGALKPTFKGLNWWMLLYTIGYSLTYGLIMFSILAPDMPLEFILLGIPFTLINAPSEEIFWRLFMEVSGKDGGISEKTRLLYSSIIFGFWHFNFIIFLMPEEMWVTILITIIGSSIISGLLWMYIFQKTGRLFPNIFSHAIANFFNIWPMMVIIMLGIPSVLSSIL